jgi:hypothetical protein
MIDASEIARLRQLEQALLLQQDRERELERERQKERELQKQIQSLKSRGGPGGAGAGLTARGGPRTPIQNVLSPDPVGGSRRRSGVGQISQGGVLSPNPNDGSPLAPLSYVPTVPSHPLTREEELALIRDQYQSEKAARRQRRLEAEQGNRILPGPGPGPVRASLASNVAPPARVPGAGGGTYFDQKEDPSYASLASAADGYSSPQPLSQLSPLNEAKAPRAVGAKRASGVGINGKLRKG